MLVGEDANKSTAYEASSPVIGTKCDWLVGGGVNKSGKRMPPKA
jgi:hypothetical protein